MKKAQKGKKAPPPCPAAAAPSPSPLDMFKDWKSDRVHKVVMENSRIRVGAVATQGPRPKMEDAYACVPDLDASSSFVALYDGHGGCAAARYCAEHLHRRLVSDPHYKKREFGRGLREVFAKMDRVMQSPAGAEELRKLAEENKEVEGAGNCGTTAAAVLILDDRLFVAHVGDSHCTLWRGNEAVAVTRDHKPETMPGDCERAVRAGATVVKNKWLEIGSVNSRGEKGQFGLQMTRALGDFMWKSNAELEPEEQAVVAVPEVVEIDLRDGGCEFLVLASDGVPRECVESICPSVHDWLLEEEEHRGRHGGGGAYQYQQGSMELAFFCDRMQSMSLEVDNKTVVLVHLKRFKPLA
ncbi:probable protein phosphatase 2C 60 [Selaginella moellendorffii]|nr:probable protein phosphatase 2C 60 [Selaginella moellendorffii]|eukprot:XP_002971876.2 probable protein phosphatase 2C 60 [Selaginella moellendorffii]